MTQENDAVDRAQEFNEAFNDAPVSANEAFAQDWLDASETDFAETSNASGRSRVVATLPDWTTFGGANDEKTARPRWRDVLRDGKLRTTGVALAAFGLGVFCASGWGGDKAKSGRLDGATGLEMVVEAENGRDGLGSEINDDALAAIDSATLRSVPESSSVDLFPQADSAVLTNGNAAVSGNWENNGVWAGSVGSANVNDWENGASSATSTGVGANNLGASTVASAPVGGVGGVGGNWNDESSWRRGVDFDRDAQAAPNSVASVEGFPTWDELGANVPAGDAPLNAPLNAPLETAAGVAPNGVPTVASSPSAAGAAFAANVPSGVGVANNTVGVANNYYPSENFAVAQNSTALGEPNVVKIADNTVYNGNAGYQGDGAGNLNGAAPQYAGNSQNSGYNQTNGSASLADFPSTAPAPAANYASTAPAPTANYASTAPAPTANYASVAPAPAANYASTAPTPTATPNWTSTGNAETSRAMVAQVPNENAPVSSPNAPVATPNLRW